MVLAYILIFWYIYRWIDPVSLCQYQKLWNFFHFGWEFCSGNFGLPSKSTCWDDRLTLFQLIIFIWGQILLWLEDLSLSVMDLQIFSVIFDNIVENFYTIWAGDFDVFMTRSVFNIIQRRLSQFPISCDIAINGPEYYNGDFVVFDVTSKEHDRTVQVSFSLIVFTWLL